MSYRINIFEQIRCFYSKVFDGSCQFKPQHVSLYVFLLNQNNRNNWVEWFKCPYDLAMSGACIGNKNTYYTCLDDLQKWGLIQYEPGENAWKAPRIKIEVLKCTSTDTPSVPQSEPLVEPLLKLLPYPIIRLITDNHKLITDNIERWVSIELNKPKVEKIKFADFVSMTEAEYSKLVETLGEEDTIKAIQILDNYKGSNGKKYKDDYRAIKSWVIDKIQKEKSSGKKEKVIETIEQNQRVKYNGQSFNQGY